MPMTHRRCEVTGGGGWETSYGVCGQMTCRRIGENVVTTAYASPAAGDRLSQAAGMVPQ